MAKQTHNWTAIKKDYYDNKYKNLKELAEAHKVKYNYLRQKAAKWDKDRPEFISDLDVKEAQEALDIPEDRKEKVRTMYDKLSIVVFKAMANIDDNFFTVDGRLKSKTLLDVASVVEKIDKGYQTGEEAKQTGQLGAYAAHIAQLRENMHIEEE